MGSLVSPIRKPDLGGDFHIPSCLGVGDQDTRRSQAWDSGVSVVGVRVEQPLDPKALNLRLFWSRAGERHQQRRGPRIVGRSSSAKRQHRNRRRIGGGSRYAGNKNGTRHPRHARLQKTWHFAIYSPKHEVENKLFKAAKELSPGS